MKPLFFSVLVLFSSAAFAGETTLKIAPARAFSQALDIAVNASRVMINAPEAELAGQLNIMRGKFDESRFGDFNVDIYLEKGRTHATCKVNVFVERASFRDLEEGVIVLERDEDARLFTIARALSVRCN